MGIMDENIQIDDSELIKIADQLREIHLKKAPQVFRSAVVVGAKPIRKQAKAEVKRLVGGNFGALLAAAIKSVKPKRSKGRRQQVYQRLVNIDKSYGTRVLRRVDTISSKGDFKPNARSKRTIRLRDWVYTSKKGKRTYLPSVIEYGHWIANQYKKYGRKVRQIPFMRRALDRSANRAYSDTKSYLFKQLFTQPKKP